MNDGIVGRPVKLNRWASDSPEKKLIPIGDLHYGAENCNLQYFLDTISYCKKTKVWILLMGDLTECVIDSKSPKGAIWEQNMSPKKQTDDLTEMLEPVKHQIVGAHDGNHEDRVRKLTTYSPTEILRDKLGVSFPLLGAQAMLEYRVQKQRYVSWSAHGKGCSLNPGYQMNKLKSFAAWNYADIFLMGHFHRKAVDSEPAFAMKNSRRVQTKQHFAITGGFLDYEKSYAEEALMRPTFPGVIKIKLYGGHHDVHLSV